MKFHWFHTHDVSFEAMDLNVDSLGIVWAYLANGMICRFDPQTHEDSEPFGERRFGEPFWVGDNAFTVDFDGNLFRLDSQNANPETSERLFDFLLKEQKKPEIFRVLRG